MANLNGFDADEVEPSVGFDPLPQGLYLAVITESEMKPTKSGNGAYLQLTFEVTEGDCKGRKVWARLNLENVSQKAVEIARSELSAICHAVGVLKPNDSEDLHDIPLIIKVAQRKRPDTGEFTNEIKGYSSREKAREKAKEAGAKKPPVNGTTPADAPWKKKS